MTRFNYHYGKFLFLRTWASAFGVNVYFFARKLQNTKEKGVIPSKKKKKACMCAVVNCSTEAAVTTSSEREAHTASMRLLQHLKKAFEGKG